MAGSKCLGSFGMYALATLVLAGLSVWHAFHTRKQFFTATIFLTTNKINVLVLSNVAFMLTLSLGRMIKYIFLGELSGQEITELERKGRIAVTETCLALTTFREELNIRMVALFTVLLFVKMFHWLAQMRIESVSVRTLRYWTHVRLSLLTLLLAASDVFCVTLITFSMLKQKGPSVLLLFAFEFMILTVVIMITAAKYLLYVQFRASSASQEGNPGAGVQGQTGCCHKHVWMFYLDFTADLLRLFLLLTFFMIICAYYGLPIHLIREVWVTFYGLRERIVKFIRYRRLLRVLDHFPAASEEERADIHCTICLDSMHSAVKLPCSHVFHKHCLYTWLFNSQRCPNCVREIPTDLARITAHAQGNAYDGPGDVSPTATPERTDAKSAQNQSTPSTQDTQDQPPQPQVYQTPMAFWGQLADNQTQNPHGKKDGKQTSQPFPASTPEIGFQPGIYTPFGFPGAVPVGGMKSEVMLKVCQKQTLLLQSHVDFLQAQLASALGMLQQQLTLQEHLLQSQAAQEMARAVSEKDEKKVQRPDSEDLSDTKYTIDDPLKESEPANQDQEYFGSKKAQDVVRSIGKFAQENSEKSATSEHIIGTTEGGLRRAKAEEVSSLSRQNSSSRLSRENSTPQEIREARLKFLNMRRTKSDEEAKKD